MKTHINLDIPSTTLDATTKERICSCSGENNNGVIETDYNTVLKPLATVCKDRAWELCTEQRLMNFCSQCVGFFFQAVVNATVFNREMFFALL